MTSRPDHNNTYPFKKKKNHSISVKNDIFYSPFFFFFFAKKTYLKFLYKKIFYFSYLQLDLKFVFKIYLWGQNCLMPFSPKLYSLLPRFPNLLGKCPSFETRLFQNRVKPYSDVFKDL